MEKQTKNISEDDKFKIHVDKKTLEDPNKTKELVRLGKRNPNIEFDLEHPAISKTSSSMISSSMVKEEPEAVIQPQDQATLKYLSNVIDNNTGEVSQPFTIGDKKYQMVRGITPDKNIMLGVYCFDDVDDNGENIIHPSDYFEKTIALPMKEMLEKEGMVKEDGYDYAAAEREFHDKEALMSYLNLSDIKPGYKHFFVDIKTGKIVAMFKTTKEMIKSGIKLGPNEDYMDLKTLKKFRFGEYFKSDVNEEETVDTTGTNVDKLKSDVKKLATLIKNKFSGYLTKLDKPIEQAQFLTAMAQEIGVPLNKLSTIISSYKDIAAQDKAQQAQPAQQGLTENKKIIKVKDIR